MLFVEIGNSTIKTAELDLQGSFQVTRFGSAEAFHNAISQHSSRSLLVANVGATLKRSFFSHENGPSDARFINREPFASFIEGTYNTPETLGLDRLLNLWGAEGDAMVISCGTAITVDALVGGKPVWGAILPGFTTAARGLHDRIPALPVAEISRDSVLPAQTSQQSVNNGVVLGTAIAVQGIVEGLAKQSKMPLPVIITGGEGEVLRHYWKGEKPFMDEALLFKGMLKYARKTGILW